VHALQLAPRHRQVAVHARADRDHHNVVALAQLGGGQVAADVDAVPEGHALLAEQVHAPVDDPLLELCVGHPEAQQAARALVALVDGDRVAVLVELGGGGQPSRARSDHPDRAAAAGGGRGGHDPALVVAARDDGQLDLLDRHRVVVDVQHAGRLARRRADQPGELGEVVGGVQVGERLLPAVVVDEVVPVGDLVAERTALLAEGHAAVHAAPALVAQRLVVGQREVLAVVAHALARVALLEADPLQAQEALGIAHQAGTFSSASSSSARL
jgi:hypothetical protein